MHAVASSIYIDAGDRVAFHRADRAVIVSDDKVTRTIILPAEPLKRIEFIDAMTEALGSARRATYREIVPSNDPRSEHGKPGEIAPND